MTAHTGMTPKQKLKILRQFDSLEGSVRDLIHRDLRTTAECQALIGALQAFKEGGLADKTQHEAFLEEQRRSAYARRPRLRALLANSQSPDTDIEPINEHLFEDIDELELPYRTLNYLRQMGIHHVGQLVQFTNDELLDIHGFGLKALHSIREALACRGLSLNMNCNTGVPGSSELIACFPKPQPPPASRRSHSSAEQTDDTDQHPPESYFYDRLDYSEHCALELPLNVIQSLLGLGITQVGELVQFTDAELRPKIGKRSMAEIKAELDRFSLYLGMDIGKHARNFPKPKLQGDSLPQST